LTLQKFRTIIYNYIQVYVCILYDANNKQELRQIAALIASFV